MATERKLVTVLFCDLVGSTGLGELLDVEALGSVQAAYFDRVRSVVEQFGGTVEKFAGDAAVAVFGVPTQHEDDAGRAVRCALALREALVGLTDTLRPRFGVELELRIGVATGDAVVGASDALATGDVMNTAARLEQAAEPGQVLVGRDTMRLTSDAVDYGDELQVEARGKREPVPAWPALEGTSRRTRARSPLVGRTAELELLAGALSGRSETASRRLWSSSASPASGRAGLRGVRRARARTGRRLPRSVPALRRGHRWLPLAGVVRQGPASGTRTATRRPGRSCTARWRRATTPRSSRSSRRSWRRWSLAPPRARRASFCGACADTSRVSRPPAPSSWFSTTCTGPTTRCSMPSRSSSRSSPPSPSHWFSRAGPSCATGWRSSSLTSG